MRRELFIVARDREDLYRYLSHTFADAENVEVIFDRRAAQHPDEAAPGEADPRRRERRSHPTVDAELRTVGYAFLVLE